MILKINFISTSSLLTFTLLENNLGVEEIKMQFTIKKWSVDFPMLVLCLEEIL